MKAQTEKLYSILSTDATLLTLLEASSSNTHIFKATPDNLQVYPCIVMEEVNSSFRTTPKFAQDITMQLTILTKNTTSPQTDLLNIHERVNALLNYYKDTDRTIVYIREALAVDGPTETDRRVFSRILRYQIWALNN